jgi:glyoxylase-like metal-dependent hydrolase (beta-lactamase superfamily II)
MTAVETARTTEMDCGITAIDTDYVRPLLDASHLIIEGGRAAFVDTGTNFSVPLLLDGLQQQGMDVADVDYVFLTHVHLDHAGGAGELMQHLPNAKAVLHPRGAPHMIDPAKLIKGASAVYGEDAYLEMYGDIRAIAADRVIVADDNQSFSLAGRALRVFYTEGHARHHYCLDDPTSEGVFTGDSFGISYRELDTVNGAFIYPTTTPVHFDPPEAHKALDRIMACEPQQLYLTHYSRVTDLARLADDMHRRIDDFVAIVRRHASDTDRAAAVRKAMNDYFLQQLREHGCTISDDSLRELLKMDVELNSMGLEFWLDHAAH